VSRDATPIVTALTDTPDRVGPDLRSRFTGLLPTRADITAVRRNPRRDLVAGITVAAVALPLALAFGVASGLGAQAGLATAVVAGIAGHCHNSLDRPRVAPAAGGYPWRFSGEGRT
jgi:Sulfate permease family